MDQILVRRLDDGVLKRIKARAKSHGRSTEAEARAILSDAVSASTEKKRSLSSFVGSVRSNRSQAEVDAYVRKLRDEWDG